FHQRPARAENPQTGLRGLERSDEIGAVQVARRFAGDDADLFHFWATAIWSSTCSATASAARPSSPETRGASFLRTHAMKSASSACRGCVFSISIVRYAVEPFSL